MGSETHQIIRRCLAVANQTRPSPSAHFLDSPGSSTYLALASLTFIRGLARSSLSRWLCSRRRRSFSSDIDCLCGRFIVVYLLGGGDGLNVGVWEELRVQAMGEGELSLPAQQLG